MDYLKSEHLKFKRTISNKLIFIVPLITAIFAWLMGGYMGYQYMTLYWWYAFLLPGAIAILCSLSHRKEENAGKYYSVFSMPVNLSRFEFAKGIILVEKLLVSAIFLALLISISNIIAPATAVYSLLHSIILNEEQRNDIQDFFADTLNTERVEDFTQFILAEYIRRDLRFRVCKFCGRYFGIMGNTRLEFCDRLIDGSTKTCKEMGSLRLYEKRKLEEPAIKEYKRSYKAHNARVRYGTMTKAEFTAWSKEARAKRADCIAGKLPLEEFVAWLDSDRQR